MNQNNNEIHEQEAAKLWNRYYIMLQVIATLINMSSMMLITLLPLYIVSLGGNNVSAGTLMTIFALTAMFFRPLFGKLLDTIGRQKVLLIGVISFGVASSFLMVTDSIMSVYILRVFQGFGLSAFSTSLGTILADVVPDDRLAEGVGYYGLSGTVAMAFGPLLSLFLLEQYGYNNTFIITVVITAMSAVATLYLRYEKKHPYAARLKEHQKANEASSGKKKGIFGFVEVSALRPCAVTILFILPISSVFTFMPLFALERGIKDIGLFFTVYSIAIFITRIFTGKIADRKGHFVIYLPTIIVTVALFVTLAYAWTLPMVLLAGVFYGVGFGSVHPILNTLVIKLSPPDRKGAANATFYATMDIGFAFGAFLWGAISEVFDFKAVFLIGAGFVVLSIVMYFAVLRGHLKKLEIS